MDKKGYFSDDCVVKNDLYNQIKDLIICPLCKKIYKEPLMCSKCQNAYCQECLEKFSGITSCPNKCNNSKFSKSISKNEFLSKLKFRCNNCGEDILQSDINIHLESNCHPKIEKKNKNKNKKTLIKVSKEEMKDIGKSSLNRFTSK